MGEVRETCEREAEGGAQIFKGRWEGIRDYEPENQGTEALCCVLERGEKKGRKGGQSYEL